MKAQKKAVSLLLAVLCIGFSFGCAAEEAAPPTYEQLAPYITSIDNITLPTKGVVAFGEATHGNRDWTLLRLSLFQQVVESSGIRAFALEGDFGGCQKVNEYITTGAGSAEQAAGEIGFAIYKTEEMVELLTWMKTFNAGKEPNQQIRFYGFDMQRFDNNKEGLFALLEQGAPALGQAYQDALKDFTDDGMYDLDSALVEETLLTLDLLYAELVSRQEEMTAAIGDMAYEMALQYATCLAENAQLRIAANYGTLRDSYMAGHVQWIYAFEAKYYDAPGIFVTGHNGHIGKTTKTIGTEKAMGELLGDAYGEAYFAIGTEFYESSFLAPDVTTGERKLFTIQNTGDQRLAVLLHQSGMDALYLDLDAAAEDSSLSGYLKTAQPMSSIGEAFSETYAAMQMAYTQSMEPGLTYDALIFADAATPSTMLAE